MLFTHPASFSPQPASQTKKCYNFVQAYSTLRIYHSSLLATRLVAQQLRLALEGVVAALARARGHASPLSRAREFHMHARAPVRDSIYTRTRPIGGEANTTSTTSRLDEVSAAAAAAPERKSRSGSDKILEMPLSRARSVADCCSATGGKEKRNYGVSARMHAIWDRKINHSRRNACVWFRSHARASYPCNDLSCSAYCAPAGRSALVRSRSAI